MALENYTISRIDYDTAMRMVIEKHYLHRVAPCSFAFGLFFEDENEFLPRLVGVITYGSPASPSLTKGIAGDEYKDQVIELTRLWVDDSVPKNGESYLIGNTLPLIDKDIVVSFAEIDQGHKGTVYQATNWLYTGESKKRTDLTIDEIQVHTKSLSNRLNAKEIKEQYPDTWYMKDRPPKHRYVYLRGNKWRKKELRKVLKYEILPYPK